MERFVCATAKSGGAQNQASGTTMPVCFQRESGNETRQFCHCLSHCHLFTDNSISCLCRCLPEEIPKSSRRQLKQKWKEFQSCIKQRNLKRKSWNCEGFIVYWRAVLASKVIDFLQCRNKAGTDLGKASFLRKKLAVFFTFSLFSKI